MWKCYRNENKAPDESTNVSWKKNSKQTIQNQSANGNSGSPDTEKVTAVKTVAKENNKRNVQEPVNSTMTRSRGRGFKSNPNNNVVINRVVETKSKGRGTGLVTENRRNNIAQHDNDQLVHDVKQINISDGAQYHQAARHSEFLLNMTTSKNLGTCRIHNCLISHIIIPYS